MFVGGSQLVIFDKVTVGDAAVAPRVVSTTDRRRHFSFANGTVIDNDGPVIVIFFLAGAL